MLLFLIESGDRELWNSTAADGSDVRKISCLSSALTNLWFGPNRSALS